MPAAMNLSFSTVTVESDFYRLQQAWSRLVDDAGTGNPFLTFEWVISWWESFSGPDDRLHIVLVHDAVSHELVGIAPLMVRKRRGVRTLQFLGSGRSDYLGFLSRDNAVHIQEAVFAQLVAGRESWDVCVLMGVMESDLSAITDSARAAGILCAHRVYEKAPYLTIGGSFADYLKARSKTFRKNYRRYDPSQMENAADFELAEIPISEESSPLIVATFESIERKSWKYAAGTPHLAQPADRQFWTRLLPRFYRNGWVSAWMLKHLGRPVAFIIGLRYGAKMFTHTSAYDSAADGAGNIVRNNLIRHAFDSGCAEFDFLCGDEAYKFLWTDEARPVYQVVLAKRAPVSLSCYGLALLRWRLAQSVLLKDVRLWLIKLISKAKRIRELPFRP